MKDSIKYSEVFFSIQGEGFYCGAPTAWLRLFACNLQCDGFGQDDPTDASTYELPYQEVDVDSINHITELPVFAKGCDTGYSWSKRYKHLINTDTASAVVDKIEALMTNDHNPEGQFGHRHMCFTGGEPLLKPNQKGVVSIIREFIDRDNVPASITFETNGTQTITDDLADAFDAIRKHGTEIFMSMSPKLFRVSGEPETKAIKPSSINNIIRHADNYQIKFVVNRDPATWEDLERIISMLESDVNISATGFDRSKVWLMPISATVEGQEEVQKQVADMACERGYNLAARVHCWIYGNTIGT